MRHDAAAAADLVHLGAAARRHQDARAYGCPVQFRLNELDLDPVVAISSIIAPQGRGLVHIKDENVNVAIMFIIVRSAPAAGEARCDARTGLRRDILELPVAQVAIRQMATANPYWGASRIHEELLKQGVGISERRVSRLMPKNPKPPSQTYKSDMPGSHEVVGSIPTRSAN